MRTYSTATATAIRTVPTPHAFGLLIPLAIG